MSENRARAANGNGSRRRLVALVLLGCTAAAGLVWSIGAFVQQSPSDGPSGAPSGAPIAQTPRTSAADAGDGGLGVGGRVDRDWLARTAELTGIPPRALAAYAGADLHMRLEADCAVGWNSLAAIGFVETEHGAIGGGSILGDGRALPRIIGIPLDGSTTDALPDTDDGAIDGDDRWDRAVGPMQFIPQTWAEWGSDGSGDGIADIDNIDDAALSAARYLCASRGSMEDSDSWIAAIRSYNDSSGYQRRVADAAARYAYETQ